MDCTLLSKPHQLHILMLHRAYLEVICFTLLIALFTSAWYSSIWQKMTYLAGRTRASSSVARCRRIMFFDGGIPKAVAIVSPVNDGSRTTSAPCTPLSANEEGH